MTRKMEAKGYLGHDVENRTYVYRPTISRKDVRHSILGNILVLSGSLEGVEKLSYEGDISVNEIRAEGLFGKVVHKIDEQPY
jgi:hypothetical protein